MEHQGKEFHPLRWLLRTLIVLIIGIAIGIYAVSHIPTVGDMFIHSEGEINGVTLFRSMKNIAEIATKEESVICEATYEEENIKLFKSKIKIPMTKKHFEIRYHGSVKAGIKDANKIQVDMDETNKTVQVTLPRSEILSTKIEPGSIELIDQSHNIFNQLKVTDVTKLEEKEETRITENAIKDGILEKADKEMRKIMSKQCKAMVGKNYQVTVVTEE